MLIFLIVVAARVHNKLVLVHVMRTQIADVKMVQPLSTKSHLLEDPWHVHRGPGDLPLEHDLAYDDNRKTFKFHSMLNNSEVSGSGSGSGRGVASC